jgi:hypothetical protein
MQNRPPYWKRSGRQLAAAIAGVILSGAVVAQADTCFLPPTYVPGLYGPPNWTGATATTSNSTGSWPTLHDPRWAGAPLQSFSANDPNGLAGAYRVAAEGDYLYVSYHTLLDIPSDVDVVYFGFSLDSTAGSNAYVIEVQPNTSGSDPVGTDVGSLWKKVAGTWSQSTDPNDWDDWLTEVVTWNNPDGLEWAINFKIKAKGAGGAGVSTNDFKVFFGLGLGITTGDDEGIVSYTTPAVPTTGSYLDNTVLQISADTTNWLTAKALGTTCPAGVSLSHYDIATTTHPSGSNWLYTDGTDNVFHIRPKSVPGRAPQLAHTVYAKMWVADWGSQIADPAASVWAPVYGTDFADSRTTGSIGSWAWTWDTTAPSGPAVGSTDDVTISFTCAKESGATFCPKLSNVTSTETERHQCVMVELRGDPVVANSSHISFSNAAAYRNMEFQGLSTYSEDATISIQGLQAITGQAKDRDVYVYVKADNMPKYGEEPSWLPSKAMADARRYAEHPPQAPAPAKPDGKKEADARARAASAASANVKGIAAAAPVPPAPAADGKAPFPDADDLLGLPVLSEAEAMATVWPTYQVFAYYDTGETVTAKGKKRKVLKAMVPFGYHFSHDGPHYGFSHSLTPVGTSWTELAPNLYKVNIPNEGKIKVRVNVTAHEVPRSKCQQCDGTPPPVQIFIKPRCYCALPGAGQGGTYGAVIGLLLGALALWTRRRSR